MKKKVRTFVSPLLNLNSQPGHIWTFLNHVKAENHGISKRTILSIFSSSFEPLEWVIPTILWVKNLIQTL